MELIRITKKNLQAEHICCAISKDTDCQVISKKSWLAERLDEGLVFLKANVRGKCFIEYIPAERAWVPVDADNYLYINCLWVSGQFKGQGYSSQLLNACIQDAISQGKDGVVILSSKKKMPFLADPKFLQYKGFQFADSALPYYELCYLPLNDSANKPKFKDHVKLPRVEMDGFVLYYTAQCPFTAKYVPLIEEIAKERGVKFTSIKITNIKDAQQAPSPFTTYSLFYNKEFVTNEILSEKKFEKMIVDMVQ
jgi:GNAT superfamily N-acetyltransferase